MSVKKTFSSGIVTRDTDTTAITIQILNLNVETKRTATVSLQNWTKNPSAPILITALYNGIPIPDQVNVPIATVDVQPNSRVEFRTSSTLPGNLKQYEIRIRINSEDIVLSAFALDTSSSNNIMVIDSLHHRDFNRVDSE